MPVSLAAFLFLLCLVCSFLYAGSETGFVSWNPLKIRHRAAKGDFVAEWGLYLLRNKTRLLSAVLIGNNASLVGATLTFVILYEAVIRRIPVDLSFIPSPESWILTPIIVLFCEMLPKSLFRIYSFRLTLQSIPFLVVTHLITLPATVLLDVVGMLFKRREKIPNETFKTKQREEVVMVAQEGAKRGTLYQDAGGLINNVLELKSRTVADVMLSRKALDTRGILFNAVDSTTVAKSRCAGLEETEFIVYDKEKDTFLGTFGIIDLLHINESARLNTIVNPLPVVDSSLTLLHSVYSLHFQHGRYYGVIDSEGKVRGILDLMTLFKSAFGRVVTEMYINRDDSV
jgi:CBS domain containing-hemolysin-like protein